MSRSQFGHVCKHGVVFKKLGIGSLMLASKPDIGFETVSRCVTRLAIVHHQSLQGVKLSYKSYIFGIVL